MLRYEVIFAVFEFHYPNNLLVFLSYTEVVAYDAVLSSLNKIFLFFYILTMEHYDSELAVNLFLLHLKVRLGCEHLTD